MSDQPDLPISTDDARASALDALSPAQRQKVEEEREILVELRARLYAHVTQAQGEATDFDRELLRLRDQYAEARLEDRAAIVEHMSRLAALRQVQHRERSYPINPQSPYFAHLRLLNEEKPDAQPYDVLIGRRAFIDSGRGIKVVDWRNAPISRIYYCYQEGEEYEEKLGDRVQLGTVQLRRTVTIQEGELRRLRDHDESLVLGPEGWQAQTVSSTQLSGGGGSALRAPSAGRQRRLGRGGGPSALPEITALIDPEQFRAITAQGSGVVIIRGGAGTGKTTIALHRAAWLHFQDPKHFSAQRMLVLTPGDALRRYVSSLLPSLDVEGVQIRTFVDFAFHSLKRLLPEVREYTLMEHTQAGAQRLKRLPTLITVLEQVVQAEIEAFEAQLQAIAGAAVMRAWVARRTLPVGRRINAMLVWLREGGAAQLGAGETSTVRRFLRNAQSELLDPVQIWLDLLTDRGRLEAALKAAEQPFYEWELDQLVSTVRVQAQSKVQLEDYDEGYRVGVDGRATSEGERRNTLDADDCALMLRICQLKYGVLSGPTGERIRYHHVVVDEAQDLSPVMIQAICHLVEPGGPVTLAGDTAQRLVLDNGFESWEGLVEILQMPVKILPALAISYRSTQEVMVVARHVLGHLAQEESAQRDARSGAPVELLRFDEMGEAVAFLADALKSLRSRERQASVALIAPTSEVADQYYAVLRRANVPLLRRVHAQEFEFTPGIDLTDVMQIKGLEYDYVVALETTAQHYPQTDQARYRLHVIFTRAAHQLWLVCCDQPSLLLPETLTLRP